jgi:ATP-dependent helicase/nuclease subunit A
LRKVGRFLERHAHWRRLARQASLSRCLEAVLAETHYAEWLLTQPRGEERHANVRRFLGLAQQFDQFQRQSLFRFLSFVEAQQLAETEPDVAAVAQENAVRLMSIHQSKGLEFPLVVAADLGKAFNLADLRAELILDETYGLCPQVQPPRSGRRYPSLPYWLASQRQRRETLGEELRLLYVAMTRARDTLVLTASISNTQHQRLWKPVEAVGPADILDATSYHDWLRLWFSRTFGSTGTPAGSGENDLVRWWILDDSSLVERERRTAAPAADSLVASPREWEQLERRLSWTYPFEAATRQPAKTTVTLLRRAAHAVEEDAATSFVPLARPSPFGPAAPAARPREHRPEASGADIGNAHHAFLERVCLERTGSLEDLRSEARRLTGEGGLRAEEATWLDFPALEAFWRSELGAEIRNHATCVRRELAFTLGLAPAELAALAGEPQTPGLEDDLVVVQGAVDLAVVMPGEIWIVDFKTDWLAPGPDALTAKVKLYAPQIKLYALALSRIYGRPVSKAWFYFLSGRVAVPAQLVQ